MSNDIQKADQIAYRFYTKLVLVVINARAVAEPPTQAKVDKWFNLETPDSEAFRDQLRIYRSISASSTSLPLELQVLLSVPELTNNQALVYLAPDSSRVRIEPTPRHILLETWRLSFTPGSSLHDGDVAPSTIYKHGIPLFRSLFSLLRMLPAWKLSKRLRRRTGISNRNGNLSIHLRVQAAAGEETDGVLAFDEPPSSSVSPLPNETHVFPSVPHPTGTLSLSVRYITSPDFKLEELESLLSSRFLSLDVGPEFTPTLAKNQQRDSISSSPGRASLPKLQLPPSTSSVADRFVLPPVNTRAISSPAAVGPAGRVVVSTTRPNSSQAVAAAGSASAISVGSSRQEGSWSKEEGRPLSGLAARLRKESTGGRGADLPSAPGPLLIRRPNINPVHPFKSSTLSSGSHSPSPSLRQPSPLSSGPGRAPQASPNSGPARVPPSPIGVNRPSPPFAPSSLGDRRSPASAETDDAAPRMMPGRKRYSSSFGHRYAATGGAGSEGSAGSGERRDAERVGNASFLSTNTDDDDISVFVQDIDARKPLGGTHRLHSRASSRERGFTAGPHTGVDVGSEHMDDGNGPPSPGVGPMLTSQSEVDERLKQMNEAFLASLEGLGGSGRRRERDKEQAEPETGGQFVLAGTGARRMTVGDVPRSRRISQRGRAWGLSEENTSSGSPSISDAGVQGSDEVIGRMSLDSGRRGAQ